MHALTQVEDQLQILYGQTLIDLFWHKGKLPKGEEGRMMIAIFMANQAQEFRQCKGVTHPTIVYAAPERPVLLCKGPASTPSLKRRILWTAGRLLGLRPQRDLCAHNEMNAAKAAYAGARFLQLPFVPPIKIVPLADGKFASFQLWQSDMIEAKKFAWQRHPTNAELLLFQTFTIYDYLMGNFDRHGENWLVQGNAQGRLKRIGMIDNDNTFPAEHPAALSDLFARATMYQWRSHPWAARNWLPGSLQRIQNIVSNLNAFIAAINAEVPNFLTGERAQRLRERASALSTVEQTLPTPRQLGAVFAPPLIENSRR